MKKRWCNYCRTNQPEEGFSFWQGKYNKTAMCARCIAARKSRQTVAERDEFGKTVTERNAEKLIARVELMHEVNQKRKQQQVKDHI